MTLLDGITSSQVETGRYTANVLEREGGSPDQPPVVLVHGNVSSSLFWQPTMLDLPVRSLAIDLRGFGDSQTRPVDATRGLRDFSDDVASVLTSWRSRRRARRLVDGGRHAIPDRPELVRA